MKSGFATEYADGKSSITVIRSALRDLCRSIDRMRIMSNFHVSPGRHSQLLLHRTYCTLLNLHFRIFPVFSRYKNKGRVL